MKKIESILFCVVLFLNITIAQNKSSVYNFPIKGGSAEWKKFNTHNEMLEACQIPQSILVNMSNRDLLLTCLNYPLFPDMWAFNSLQNGFENVKKGFNGLQELFNRKDMVNELVAEYEKMDPDLFEKNGTLLEHGKYAMEFAKIEILLAQSEILESMPTNGSKKVLTITYKNFEKMLNHKELYSISSLEPIAYLMAKILQKEEKAEFEQKLNKNKNLLLFSKTASMASIETINEISELVKNYLLK